MQVYRRTACTYYNFSRFQKAAFFQNNDLVKENIIQAVFFIIIKGPYTPAQT